ncbi:MAG: hypothetical protein LLF80_00100 [Porphyromonadaceae bacterium]|nr:hypothetical protein [Porphyromonadaceae bacterium]
MKIKNNILLVFFFVAALLLNQGCDSMEDNYKQYLGEYNYSGKINNLRTYAGYERVILAWDNPKDQKSKSIMIIYGADSTVVSYDSMVDSVSIDGLNAGTGYEFIVYSLDADKNVSVPTKITAFPVSKEYVESLTPATLIVEEQNNEQVISFIGMSNVLMMFSGKINFTITGPDNFNLTGNIDITDQVVSVDPVSGAKTINTISEFSVPVKNFGIDLIPEGDYSFNYTISVWPISGTQITVDEVPLNKQVEMRVPRFIINLMRLGGTITTSGDNGPNEGISKLIDGNIGTKVLYKSRSSVSVVYKQTKPSIVTKYTLTSANDAAERDPLRWTLYGSNNGTTWTVIDTRDNIDFPLRQQTLSFEIPDNTASFTQYKLDMVNNSGNMFQLAEWALYGPKL